VVATKSSLHFYDWQALEKEHEGRVRVWTDQDEWEVCARAAEGGRRAD
jgi:phosphopantothenoylcysteine decarboxylase